MIDVFRGIAAGVFATAVLSALLLLQRALGIAPQLDLIAMLSSVLGAPGDRLVGWIVHVGLGTVAGGALFAWLEPRLGADSMVKRGVLFGVLAWLALMVVFMPSADAGMFGLRLGAVAPIALLLPHVLYGAVLGWFYGVLLPTQSLETRDSSQHSA